jgi:hypothetical protein
MIIFLVCILQTACASTGGSVDHLKSIDVNEISSIDLCVIDSSSLIKPKEETLAALTVEHRIQNTSIIAKLVRELKAAAVVSSEQSDICESNAFSSAYGSYQIFRDRQMRPLLVVRLESTLSNAITIPVWKYAEGVVHVDDGTAVKNSRMTVRGEQYRRSIRDCLLKEELNESGVTLLALVAKICSSEPAKVRFYSKKYMDGFHRSTYSSKMDCKECTFRNVRDVTPVFSIYGGKRLQGMYRTLAEELVEKRILRREISSPPRYFRSHEYFDKTGKSCFIVSILGDDGRAYIERTPLRHPEGPSGGMVDDGYFDGHGMFFMANDLMARLNHIEKFLMTGSVPQHEKLLLLVPVQRDDLSGNTEIDPLVEILSLADVRCRIERKTLTKVPSNVAIMGELPDDSSSFSVFCIFGQEMDESKILTTMVMLEDYRKGITKHKGVTKGAGRNR